MKFRLGREGPKRKYKHRYRHGPRHDRSYDRNPAPPHLRGLPMDLRRYIGRFLSRGEQLMGNNAAARHEARSYRKHYNRLISDPGYLPFRSADPAIGPKPWALRRHRRADGVLVTPPDVLRNHTAGSRAARMHRNSDGRVSFQKLARFWRRKFLAGVPL